MKEREERGERWSDNSNDMEEQVVLSKRERQKLQKGDSLCRFEV